MSIKSMKVIKTIRTHSEHIIEDEQNKKIENDKKNKKKEKDDNKEEKK